MAKMKDKVLALLGLEPVEYDEYDGEEEENDMTDNDDMDFVSDGYETTQAAEKKISKRNRDRDRGDTGKVIGIPDTSKVRVLIYKPVSYEDTQSIIDNLKEKKPIVINLDELDTDVAQRILDFVSGAVYALNGNIRKAARNIFVVAPDNVDVSTNTAEAVDDFGFGGYLEKE